MKYLVIGSGGREHAIAWRLLTDGSAKEVFVAPGNGGIQPEYRVDLKPGDFGAIGRFCADSKIDMVVIGPEVPLVEGVVDYLEEMKIPVFGPAKKAAMIEGSKIFAKDIMEKYAIPTARHREFRNKRDLANYIDGQTVFPLVIKLDGLAAGKGVGISENRKEAMEFIEAMVKDDSRVFVEDFIEGEEASVLGISDGETVLPMTAAQDHKRIGDGDRGPNTGGMGAYAPAPLMDDARMLRVYREILQPAVDGMRKEGIPFKGVLYAGVIVKGESIKVLEFNARFGDPETQVILPLLNNRLGDIFERAASGRLKGTELTFQDKYAITVVVASAGYPGSYEKGKKISGLEKVNKDAIVFHAGTEFHDGAWYTNGGRVLNVTALGGTLAEARDRAYEAVAGISFEGAYYRNDIGHRALK